MHPAVFRLPVSRLFGAELGHQRTTGAGSVRSWSERLIVPRGHDGNLDSVDRGVYAFHQSPQRNLSAPHRIEIGGQYVES